MQVQKDAFKEKQGRGGLKRGMTKCAILQHLSKPHILYAVAACFKDKIS